MPLAQNTRCVTCEIYVCLANCYFAFPTVIVVLFVTLLVTQKQATHYQR